MRNPKENEQVANKLIAEARTIQFIAEFELWLFDQYHRALLGAAPEVQDTAELTSLVRPWIDELAGLCRQGSLGFIPLAAVAKLHCFLNYTLDGLANQYRRCGASPAVMIIALTPVDDILVFLSLAQRVANNSAAHTS